MTSPDTAADIVDRISSHFLIAVGMIVCAGIAIAAVIVMPLTRPVTGDIAARAEKAPVMMEGTRLHFAGQTAGPSR